MNATESTAYDAIVIGSGPGGYPAAIRLGQLGLKTLCIEKGDPGGVCLNWGCIPSKALISAAHLVDEIEHGRSIGISAGPVTVDYGAVQKWKDGIVESSRSSVRQLLKSNRADLVIGTARFTARDEVTVATREGDRVFRANKGIVVATGARVVTIRGFEPDGAHILTAREAIDLREVPKSLVVIGGGVIGLELGMMFQKLGTKITVLEATDALLPTLDRDLVAVVAKKFEKAGGEVFTNARAKSWSARGDGTVTVAFERAGEGSREVVAEKVLVAVGFAPNTSELGLDTIGVRLDARAHIRVDDRMQSNVPGVYAIGDVSGGPYLAHKATREGEIAAEVIAGMATRRDWRCMPSAVFTDPEVATAGLSESEARAAGGDVRVGKFPFAASGRARALRAMDGFVKVIVGEEARVLGVAIVGAEASELISEAALALEMDAFAEDIALTVHPHPTMSEGVMEAFKHALGEAIQILNPRRNSLNAGSPVAHASASHSESPR